MDQLAEFISMTLSLADKRNLAKENPIVVTIPVANAESIITVVSHLEPNHVTLPFNVIWIVADPDSVDYAKAFRRLSALPYGGRRNTWANLTTYQDILDEPQFYDRTATFQLGEVQTSGVQPATDKVRGTFKLLDVAFDPLSPVVVGDNDPRMTNARTPKPHSHPLLPYSAVQGSGGINNFYVNIEDSLAPTAGQVLMIKSVGTKPREMVGVWRNVVASDMVYDGPEFTNLTIIGPTVPVNEGQPIAFRANALFSDGSTQLTVPARWSIIANGSVATISETTGVFVSHDVNGNQTVRVQARWTHPDSNVLLIQTFDVDIIDTTIAKVLLSIEIVGPTTVNENTQASYSVLARYDDGSTAGVTPNTFISSNSGAGTFNAATGILSVPELLSNQQTTLSASYTENGISTSATLVVNAIDLTVYPQTAVINGPSEVSEGTNVTYTLTVAFTDLSSRVVAVSNWASSNPAAGVLNAGTGYFDTPDELTSDVNTIISASYSSAGRTVSATKNVTVKDTTNYPVSAVIYGASELDEGETSTYTLEVTFTNATKAVVPVTNWASSNTAVATIHNVSGVLTALPDIKPSGTTNVTASYSQFGRTVSATKAVLINDTTNYPVSAVIVGSASMDEGTTQTVGLDVTYLDGSVQRVPVTNWASTDTSALTVGASTGLVTATANAIGNKVAQIMCTYTEHGTLITPSALTVVVSDTTVYPVSATIEGPTAVAEGTNMAYSLRVVFDDGTNRIVTSNNWASSNPVAGVIAPTTGVFTAAANLGNVEETTISASYTLDGVTVSDSLLISVEDTTVYPVIATIVGPATIDEKTTGAYSLEVQFTDGSTSTVPVTNWSVNNPSIASINSNTGLMTTLEVVGNQPVTVSASYTSVGVTVSDTLVVTVIDLTIYPQSAIIIGSNSINEGGNATYLFNVTYDDGTVLTVNPTNWASNNTSAATIGATTGILQAASNVIGNKLTVLSASFTEHGVTVTDTLNVTVTDTTVYPVSAVIEGTSDIDELTSTTFRLRVTFADSSTLLVPVTNWASSNPLAGTINATTGVFSAAQNSTKADILSNITASYTLDGTTVVAPAFPIAVADTTIYPVSARIVGLDSVDEGSLPFTYLFEVTFSDGSVENEAINNWSSSNPTAGTIHAVSGSFAPAANVLSDQITTISGSFSAEGETVTATLELTVVDTTIYPASIVFDGPAVVNESSSGETYQAVVTYTDSHIEVVSLTNWTSSNPALVAVNATTGAISIVGDVIGAQSVTLTGSYTEQGRTINGTTTISLVDDILVPVSATILGSSAVGELATGNYQFEVTYDDGTKVNKSVADWASDNTLAGTINATSGVFTALEVVGNQTVTISASYTELGVTVTGTKVVTVIDSTIYPASAVILGSAALNENDAATYQLQVTYSDASVGIVTATDWASDNALAGTITSTGVFTANNTDKNEVTTITASFTEYGVTVTGTFELTVVDLSVPVSADISGPTEAVAGDAPIQLSAIVEFNDATSRDETVNGVWTHSNPNAGTIDANTGIFTPVSQ